MGLSKFASCLPENYGYVVLVGCVGNTFVNIWMAINVGKARKRFDVPYPEMYCSSKEFNCIQRAHQNTLEGQGQFLMNLFIGGLQYPRLTAGVGVMYLVSRIAYALGYYTGDPDKRRWGAFGHIAELMLLGHAISFAAHQLEWV
ncbi:glutathione S-transferase 3, mitochondrial-like [Babylonia areolata]|uniref:glutathione S-transferase 3, mitochondrial-like n=1 Tax=Babylonia areolata TaxID=304850 RepID=UPI003FD5761D